MRRAIFIALVAPALLVAADWPQFRGPERTGVSKEKGLLKTWPKGGPKLLWSINTLGSGYSAPAIVGEKIYILGGDGKDEYIYALDAKDGKQAWAAKIGSYYSNPWGGGPRGTPTVDGDHLYALGGQGTLVCVTTAGKEVWRVSLPKDLDGKLKKYAFTWGYTESPLIDGDKVIVTPGGSKGTMAALNKKTGKVIWRTKDWTDDIDYGSPVKHTYEGVSMYVQMTGAHVAGISPEDGSVLWKVAREAKITIPTPICSGKYVYVCSAYGRGCDLIELSVANKKVTAKEAYDDGVKKVMQNHHGGVILLDGHVYGHSDRGGWTCQELKTGKKVWSSTKLGKGSIVYADGCFYCYAEADGTLAVIEATTKGWTEKARFKIAKSTGESRPRMTRTNYWAHPVIANGKLYLRDQEVLCCYDIKGK